MYPRESCCTLLTKGRRLSDNSWIFVILYRAGGAVGFAVGDVVGGNVGDAVGDIVGGNVGDAVGDIVGGNVGDAVGGASFKAS